MKKMERNKDLCFKFKELMSNGEPKTQIVIYNVYCLLMEIPELFSYIQENDPQIKNQLIHELAKSVHIKEFRRGEFIQKILDKHNNFNIILFGDVLQLGIKFIEVHISFKEYILYLTKLFLLNEMYLYKDCIDKNSDKFPLKSFSDKKHENIDITQICMEINLKNFVYKDELEKLKEKINNSKWKKFTKEIKRKFTTDLIDEFLKLYNPEINSDYKYNFVSSEMKYTINLPFFVKNEIYPPIFIFGDFNKPQNEKNYKGYLSLNNRCFAVYLDKSSMHRNEKIFDIYNKQNAIDVTENLIKEHYIFKDITAEFMKNNFCKFIQKLNLTKNEILFEQDKIHKGVYFITKGLFQLRTNRAFNELIKLNFLINHSLDAYPNYVSKLKNELMDENQKNKIFEGYYDYNSPSNDLMKESLFINVAKEKKEIVFFNYSKNDIIGLNEVFDYRSGVNLFTAKCISEESEIYFLSSEIFNNMLIIEDIYQKIGKMIDEKAILIVKCINKYRFIFEKKIEYKLIGKIKSDSNYNLRNAITKYTISNKNKNSKNINTFNKLQYNSTDKKTKLVYIRSASAKKSGRKELKKIIESIPLILEDHTKTNSKTSNNFNMLEKIAKIKNNFIEEMKSNSNNAAQDKNGTEQKKIRNIRIASAKIINNTENILNGIESKANKSILKNKNKSNITKSNSSLLNVNNKINKNLKQKKDIIKFHSGKKNKRIFSPTVMSYIYEKNKANDNLLNKNKTKPIIKSRCISSYKAIDQKQKKLWTVLNSANIKNSKLDSEKIDYNMENKKI